MRFKKSPQLPGAARTRAQGHSLQGRGIIMEVTRPLNGLVKWPITPNKSARSVFRDISKQYFETRMCFLHADKKEKNFLNKTLLY